MVLLLCVSILATHKYHEVDCLGECGGGGSGDGEIDNIVIVLSALAYYCHVALQLKAKC